MVQSWNCRLRNGVNSPHTRTDIYNSPDSSLTEEATTVPVCCPSQLQCRHRIDIGLALRILPGVVRVVWGVKNPKVQ
jgi:hypothetical protein